MRANRTGSFAAFLPLVVPVIATFVGLSSLAGAQTFSVVYDFGQGAKDPYEGVVYGYPGILAQGRDGNIYGTAISGGSFGFGGAFRITPSGTFTTLHSFGSNKSDGKNPFSGLTLGSDGNFYGGTSIGGGDNFGVLFRLSASGGYTQLHSFTNNGDGGEVSGPPIQGTDGNFYGATAGDFGTIYKMTPSGTLTTLNQGIASLAPLVQGTDGNFHGTSEVSNLTVFKMTPAGKTTVTHSSTGSFTVAPLIQGSDGNYYGTTMNGGPTNGGIVFKITPGGTITVLHNFDMGVGSIDGNQPSAGLVQATDGNFYGVTQTSGANAQGGPGTIFKITSSGDYTQLFVFSGTGTGAAPGFTLIQHTNGKLYGFTANSGTFNKGTFFSFDVGLGPFIGLLPVSAKVGKTVGILGQGFTGTKSVQFNGTGAAFVVVSDTYLTATVPVGATTGFVTVTTTHETLSSNKKFRLLH